MSRHLQRDLAAVERDILAMSSLVEEMIDNACCALRETRIDLASEVIAQERDVDNQEVQIEEECLKILALHQPVAVDLRRTAMLLKINNDLERMADLAVNIAEQTNSLAEYPEFTNPTGIDQMARLATGMVNAALDAFVKLDSQAARDICRQDDLVDDLNREVINELYELMRNQPEMVKPSLHFFSASRHVERIADLATNIAEDVIYLVDGEIARHRLDDTQATS